LVPSDGISLICVKGLFNCMNRVGIDKQETVLMS